MPLSDRSRVVVVGLGYVGLPLAVALAKSFDVLGLDIDAGRVAELRSGHDRTREIDDERLRESTLRYSSEVKEARGADLYIVTVPTPVDQANQPDLRPVLGATRALAGVLEAASKPIIVYESTVYPGVTEEICGPEIEARAGRNAEENAVVPAPEPEARAAPPRPPPPQAPVQVVVDANYLKQVFKLIDYDGNGEVTLVEFLSALHSNPEIGALLDEGTPAGDDVSNVVSEVFSRMDADQNKSVNFEEFVEYFTVQQNAHSNHALNKLSRDEKKALLMSFDQAKVRSMSAFKRGIRYVSKQALKAGLRTSEKEKKEENMSKIPDSDLLVLKSYLRDVYKIVDYEKNERIVLQEFLDELRESPNIALALDVGSDISHGADKTKKMVAVIFKAMSIDAKRVVTFPEFVNYFIKIASDYFNSDSPLSQQSVVSESRSASANSTIGAFVGELFKFGNKTPSPAPVAEERVASRNGLRPHGDDDYMDGLVYGDDENEDLDHTVHLLRHELQQMNAVLEENQHQKKMNNALRLKLNVLTHMYAKQSAEFQALIDSMK